MLVIALHKVLSVELLGGAIMEVALVGVFSKYNIVKTFAKFR